MKKLIILGLAIVFMLSVAPVMAADFHAVSNVSGAALTPMTDNQLDSVEGTAWISNWFKLDIKNFAQGGGNGTRYVTQINVVGVYQSIFVSTPFKLR